MHLVIFEILNLLWYQQKASGKTGEETGGQTGEETGRDQELERKPNNLQNSSILEVFKAIFWIETVKALKRFIRVSEWEIWCA